jgi:WD40 repeat protein
VWCGRFSPHNRDIFVTCGGNGGLNIYKYHYSTKANGGSSKRVKKHPRDELPMGVAGSCELLNSRILSTQPINSFDWSPDKQGLCVMTSFDQTLRVQMITKLEKH